MPGLDGTGPMGMGPMTGRGLGNCTSGVGRVVNYVRGRGRGRGWFCNRAYSYLEDLNAGQVIDEKATLKKHLEYYENELKQIKEQLKKFDEKKE